MSEEFYLTKGTGSLFLYHLDIENDSDRVLKKGLNHSTATKWYSSSGKLFAEIDCFRPAHLPKWIDFKVAFGAHLEPFEKPYFQFPMFSDKILVFNLDISSELFAYLYEDVKGLPSKEDLVKQYWESMHTLEEFLRYKPFNNPEIFIFEAVPAMLIEYIE